MKFRRAAEADLERLTEIHLAAYPDDRSVEARARNFTHNPFGSLADLVVAEESGVIVAHAFLFPFRASFGGRKVKVGGIASVGVAPEARGRGVATALMAHLHHRSDRRGDAVTMLYAFRQGFYARFGYGTTTSRKRIAFEPRSVPAAWRALARERVRGVRPGDHKLIRQLHALFAAGASGVIERPKRLWERLLVRERRHLLVCDGGYVAFTLWQASVHGPTRLHVDEIIAVDDASRRALFGALGAMRDQVSEIVVEISDSDPFERALIDPDRHGSGTDFVEHDLGQVVGGPMIRIADVPRALMARGYRGSGSFDIVVREDDAAEADVLAARVRVKGGRADVGTARGGGGALRTTRAGLAAIFYGALSVRSAVALGLADVDERVASRIEDIASIPAVAPFDAF